MWRRTNDDPSGWVRTERGPPCFTITCDSGDELEKYRCSWPDALVARLLSNGTSLSRAVVLGSRQLTSLRIGRGPPHPRDAVGGWDFAQGLHVTGELAMTLNRMFYGTNFASVDDEWAWKHLFEAGMASVPPLAPI